MKKLFTIAVLSAVLFNFPVYAGMSNISQQPTMEMMTVEQIQGLGNNAPVMLEGMIIESMGNQKYKFKDLTGAIIMVEIDDEDWNKIKAGPEDMVIITGETDKEGNLMEINVETIALKQ